MESCNWPSEPHMHATVGNVPGVTLFLLLKAFSSGASSLTGVEAISNAVTNFKDPGPKNVKTLVTMGGILAFLLVGIVGLAYWYGVMPETETTVLSQLAMNILGHNRLLFCSGYNSNDFSFSEYRFYISNACR